jgi:hypothetical protein
LCVADGVTHGLVSEGLGCSSRSALHRWYDLRLKADDRLDRWRTHLSLEMDGPEPRPVQSPEHGKVIEIPEVGGLHHHYQRRVA